jgi:uncharacterized protein (TIGR02466 family)
VSTGLQRLFPPRILAAPQQRQADATFNRQLLRECLQLREDDAAGRAWSKTNYLGGFTSYGSVSRMHQMSPTFARLAKRIDRHVARFAKALQFDLRDRQLEMTDCWVNIMPQGVVHSLHLHPLSTFSGTYYVQTPRGVPGLKFEDPRLDRYMAAPPRLPDADLINRPWVIMPATAGSLLLFESWLRHEVMPNPVARERISISFNYSWF